jgi:hypothetical protein
MQDRDRFCCIGCENLLAQEEAHTVFRTGFFRTIHPLGYCKNCYETAANAAAARLDNPKLIENDDIGASVLLIPDNGGNPRYEDPVQAPPGSYPMVVSL